MPDTKPRFRWYELMTTDTKGAAAFYGAVVGWRAEAVPGTDMAYTLFHVGDAAGAMAGMLTLSPEMAAAQGPVWMGYVAVPDVDDYAQRLVKAGGSVHQPPTDIPGVLRMAGVKDPTGTPFVIYKGIAPEGGPEGPPEGAPDEPGYVGWRELWAGDGAEAWAFYSGLFGWNEASVFDMGAMGAYRLWSTKGGQGMDGAEGGMMTGPAGAPPMWNFYFQVDGIDDATARITAAGGKITNGPMQVPSGGWIVQATDPQGAAFNLLSATK